MNDILQEASECPHCNVGSIREAKVTEVEHGWENDPPSLDDFGVGRICYICLCGWTIAGEFVKRGQSCSGDAGGRAKS